MSENIEITLNGVNVSGCKYLNNSKEGLLCTLHDYGVFYDMRCSDNPDCYYKQLQREKLKNEKLAKDNNVLNKTLKEIEKTVKHECVVTCEYSARYEFKECCEKGCCCLNSEILQKIEEVKNDN